MSHVRIYSPYLSTIGINLIDIEFEGDDPKWVPSRIFWESLPPGKQMGMFARARQKNNGVAHVNRNAK